MSERAGGTDSGGGRVRRRRYCAHSGPDGRRCARCRTVLLWKVRLSIVGLAVAAAALAALSAGTARALSGYTDEDRAYRDARPCAEPADGNREHRDCLRTVSAVVRAVIDVGGKNPRHELLLESDEFANRRVPVGGSGALIDSVSRGDAVTVTMWRDRVVEVHAAGRSEVTRDTPNHDATGAVVVIGLTVPLIPVAVRLAAWLLRHRRAVVADEVNPVLYAWGPLDAGLAAAALGALTGGLTAPMFALGKGVPARATAAAVLGALAFVAAGAAARSLTPSLRRRDAARTGKSPATDGSSEG
ncbi:hypothetical protein [Yinghuangia sp. YIM S09857]|uniref:hypothetical protein n=1 Tax=Yinghuangia sp. YIM S09857 TaxID=3436929 RepID=UPI003F5388A4